MVAVAMSLWATNQKTVVAAANTAAWDYGFRARRQIGLADLPASPDRHRELCGAENQVPLRGLSWRGVAGDPAGQLAIWGAVHI
jgi:hypothetical protein